MNTLLSPLCHCCAPARLFPWDTERPHCLSLAFHLDSLGVVVGMGAGVKGNFLGSLSFAGSPYWVLGTGSPEWVPLRLEMRQHFKGLKETNGRERAAVKHPQDTGRELMSQKCGVSLERAEGGIWGLQELPELMGCCGAGQVTWTGPRVIQGSQGRALGPECPTAIPIATHETSPQTRTGGLRTDSYLPSALSVPALGLSTGNTRHWKGRATSLTSESFFL